MTEDTIDEKDIQNKQIAYRLKNILTSSLGANGLLIRDNEVQFIIYLIDAYTEGFLEIERPNE